MKKLTIAKVLTSISIASLFCTQLFALDTSFSGSSKTAVEAYMPGTENAGDFSNLKETLQAELDVRADESRLFVSGNLTFDALKARGDTGTDAYDLASNLASGISGSVKEAWFDWISPASESGVQFGFKLGRQITSWGKADGIRIADILCSQDLSSLSATDYSESRLGFDGLTLTLSGDVFSANAYVIPFFKPSVLPLEETNPLRKILLPQSVNIPALNTSIPVSVGSIESPEVTLANATYAMRLSFWLPAMDFSAYVYYGFDDMPILNYEMQMSGGVPSGIEVSGDYHKYFMAGLDAAIPVSNFVFRFEGASFFDRAINTTAEYILSGGDSYFKKNQLLLLAGIDFTYGDWTLTAQYYEDILFGYDKNCDREFREPGSTLSVSKSLLGQTLELSFTGAILWNDFDSVLSVGAGYSLTDQITLNLEAAEYLEGPENKGTYGQYHDLSSIVLSGVYKF